MTSQPVRPVGPGSTNTDDEPTIGRLVSDVSRDVSKLVNQEIQLAKSELKVSAKVGGVGVGLLAAAAFVVVLAVIMLSVALAYFIHWNGAGLDLHWAFLIVFGFYVLVAGVLGLVGYRKVQAVKPPERAIHQAQETKKALSERKPDAAPGPEPSRLPSS